MLKYAIRIDNKTGSHPMTDPVNPGDVLKAVQSLIHAHRQTNRLLRLTFPRDDAPAGALLVANTLDAFEGVSRDFEFKVEILSDSPRHRP
jgi:hypothetical protein